MVAHPEISWGSENGRKIQQEAQFEVVQSLMKLEPVSRYYKKLRDLGDGKYGNVYKASVVGNEEQMVAIKTIKLQKPIEKDAETTREIDLMLRIDHRNLVKIYGVFVTTGLKKELSLVMELIAKPESSRGGGEPDLFSYIHMRPPLPVLDICKIAYQV